MKNIFEEHLYKTMQKNKKVVSIFADSDFAYYEEFEREFRGRYFNFGIAESNAVAAAAGMAKASQGDIIPIIYTAGAFLAYRAYEFIRNNICLLNLNVKIVGMGSGLKINNFGPTHHTTEDIALLRSLPNMCILSPASPNEVAPIVDKALSYEGPVYIRLGKAFETEIYDRTPSFSIGKSNLIQSGKDLTIVSTGSIISNVIEATQLIEKKGYGVDIINMSTIKPIDAGAIIKSANKTGCVVVVEEHQKMGGLGGAVSEVLCANGIGVKFESVGLNDKFCCAYGWHKDLLDDSGLSSLDIFNACINVLNK